MFQFINKSKNWVVTIVLAIIIGLAVPSLIALASSVIGDNMVITNPTEQLRLGYNASIYTSITTDASSSLSIIPNGSAGGWKIVGNSTSPNFIGGYSGNSIGEGSTGSVILSGGNSGNENIISPINNYSTITGGNANKITVGGNNLIGGGVGNIIGNATQGWLVLIGVDTNLVANNNVGYANIVGGQGNIISGNGHESFIGGGYWNVINSSSSGSGRDVISGGSYNYTSGNGWGTIGGGQFNQAYHYGFVGGGASNIAGNVSGKNYSVAVGGKFNTASGHNSMILGGDTNTASGTLSFASGKRAKAYNDGSFVWADNNNFDFLSAVNNETAFRSTGGVRFVTAIDGSGNATRTAQFATTGDLNLNGGIKLNTVTTKPACSSTYRGMFWVTQSAAGVKDAVEVCAKDAGDAYAWRTIY